MLPDKPRHGPAQCAARPSRRETAYSRSFFHPIQSRNKPRAEPPRAGPTSFRRSGDSALQEHIVTIRAKLINLMASFIAAIALVVSFMAYYAYEDSYQIAVSGSKTTVQSVTNYVSLFFNTAEDNSAFLAGLPQTAEAAGHLPSHVGLSASKTHTRREMSPQALELDKILEQLAESSSSYLAVGLGSADGGFLEYPPIAYPAGFDPRKRPWYQSAVDSGTGAAHSVYLTAAGTPVCSFVHTVKDGGRTAGVSYIEVSLATLSKSISAMEIGRTGRLTLIDSSGIIVATRNTEALFSKVTDKKMPGLDIIYAMPNGVHMAEVNGRDVLVNIFSDQRGWKYIYAIDADEVFEGTYAMLRISVIFSLVMAVAVFILGALILRSINRPLGLLSSTSETIADGDIQAALPDRTLFSGELLSLYESFAKMLAHINETLRRSQESEQKAHSEEEKARASMLRAEEAGAAAQAKTEAMLGVAESLDEAIRVISDASGALSVQIEQSDRIASESARSLAEAATAINEMNATVQEVARNVSSTSQFSGETRAKAESGAQIVHQSLQSIERVHAVSLELRTDMEQLNEHAGAISRIMTVISDIADQTNLLALNAAIEAARAGEAGRGFAVVADEVRKLAEKTMASTHDVSSAIQAIQESTNKSMASVENAVLQIDKATGFANDSGHALTDIVSTAEATADQVRAIATASEQQSAASEEINANIERVNSMVGQTAESMAEAARAVAGLAAQTEGLRALVARMQEQ